MTSLFRSLRDRSAAQAESEGEPASEQRRASRGERQGKARRRVQDEGKAEEEEGTEQRRSVTGAVAAAGVGWGSGQEESAERAQPSQPLSLIHISEPTRPRLI
eukprot:642261-Rhodomonas_salina.1